MKVARRLRLERGWTAEALANRSKLSQQTISSFERGKRVTINTPCRIADALGVELGEIVVLHSTNYLVAR